MNFAFREAQQMIIIVKTLYKKQELWTYATFFIIQDMIDISILGRVN